MLDQRMNARDSRPLLLTVIHTEEEFNWSEPFARHNVGVTHMAALPAFQNLFDRAGVAATYVLDYPVASTEFSIKIMRDIAQRSNVTLGAHLHPWVSPPFEEEVNARNSYPCNLPADLEKRKLLTLTNKIEQSFGVRPDTYVAGRYGASPRTEKLLGELGYSIDLSPVATYDFSKDGGPDYSAQGPALSWSKYAENLIRIPHTAGYYGILTRAGSRLPWLEGAGFPSRLIRAVASRLGLCHHGRISPEGFSFAQMRDQTQSLFRDGLRLFVFSLHSPSAEPGHTPYVSTQADLDKFVAKSESYFSWFAEVLDGRFVTPYEVHESVKKA